MKQMAVADWLTVLNDEVITCTRCPRLVAYREQIAREKRRAYRDCEYWGKPVPGFGDPSARVLFLGLAPGAHGRTAPLAPAVRSLETPPATSCARCGTNPRSPSSPPRPPATMARS